jgi:hypothetical protein
VDPFISQALPKDHREVVSKIKVLYILDHADDDAPAANFIECFSAIPFFYSDRICVDLIRYLKEPQAEENETHKEH